MNNRNSPMLASLLGAMSAMSMPSFNSNPTGKMTLENYPFRVDDLDAIRSLSWMNDCWRYKRRSTKSPKEKKISKQKRQARRKGQRNSKR